MRRLVVLLAYNERECIRDTIVEVRGDLPDVDILVVDDGSEDETADIARAAGAAVVRHPINLGVAAAESTGLIYAARAGYTSVVRMDGDGQHAPRSAGALFDALGEGTELVIGSRFLGGEHRESSRLRKAGSRYLAFLLSLLCGRPVSDPTSGFRGFSGRAIESFARSHPHDYPEPESVFMAFRQGLRIREVPVQMRPRRTGSSSLTPLRSGFYMVKVSFALLLERLRPTVQP
jgi:glycosyltransferase involved in cell wall biosynthesis